MKREYVLESKVVINQLTLRPSDSQPGDIRQIVDYKIHPGYDPRLWVRDKLRSLHLQYYPL